MIPAPAAGDGDTGGGAAFTVRQRWLLLAATALVMMLRLPHAWWPGRFVGEEGTVFFAYAWHRPAAEALLRSFGGYLNIAANAITLAAAWLVRRGLLPLDRAPLFTMTAATAFQLIPAALILFGRASWLASRRLVLFALLLIAAAPMTEEVFANTLHIQFHLTLACAIVLALDPPRTPAGRAGTGAILLLAPLCGPGAVLLLPLFLARAALDRDPRRLLQALILAAAAALQLLLFFRGSPIRGHWLDPVTLAVILAVRLVGLPLLSQPAMEALSPVVIAAYLRGGAGWIATCLVAALALGGAVTLVWRSGSAAARWLGAASLLLAFASFGGGMINVAPGDWFTTGAGERYAFVPLVLIGLAVAIVAATAAGRARRIAMALCALALLSCLIAFAMPIPEIARGPDWRREVAMWRADHRHLLASWPEPWGWRVDLSDSRAPCPRRPWAAREPGDPTYCEGSWVARLDRATAAAIAEQDRTTAAR